MIKYTTKKTVAEIEVSDLSMLVKDVSKLPAKEIIDIRDENDISRIPVALKTTANHSENDLLKYFDEVDLGRSCLDYRGIENYKKTADGYTFTVVFWYNP